ncbi:MAG: hypothetical protein IKQ71_10015 [Lachnospiraceae bacterium]|nr:hypothetical protein [Lachnospiraceae bacterium]
MLGINDILSKKKRGPTDPLSGHSPLEYLQPITGNYITTIHKKKQQEIKGKSIFSKESDVS